MEIYTADLLDQNPETKVLDPIFKSFGQKESFYGPVKTLKVFEDNALVKSNLQENGAGRVLVVDGGGSLRRALMGDNLAALLEKNNWAGAVIFGCIRDSKLINKMNVGIKAINTNPRKTEKRGEGQIDLSLNFAGHEITPNSYIYSDNDGIILSLKPLI